VKGKLVSVLLLAAAACGALTSVFRAEPRTAAWSGWTELGSYNYVSEIITLNVDTLRHIDLFVGFNEGGGNYNVNVYSHPGGVTELATGTASPPLAGHQWLGFTLTIDEPDSFVKGRRYRVEFSREGNNGLHYYWNYCATRYDRA
jgi:hypothetical protein